MSLAATNAVRVDVVYIAGEDCYELSFQEADHPKPAIVRVCLGNIGYLRAALDAIEAAPQTEENWRFSIREGDDFPV